MRILFFVISIYNTFEDVDKATFEEIIKKLEAIADIEQDQVILISFCDETENKNIIINYYRKISEYIEYKKIYFGNQFLGDLYYTGVTGKGAMLYDKPFNKYEQISEYAKSIEENDNFINLYYLDSNADEDKFNKSFEGSKDISVNLVKDAKNADEIVESLQRLIDNKKLLEYK